MNEIIISKSYGIETLDTAIKNCAEKAMSANASVKEFANTLGALKIEHDKHDVVKSLKFPEWVDSMYSGKVAGQTAYKYAQVSIAFSFDPSLWDVLTLSKLSILLNARSAEHKEAVQAAWAFFAWYGDTINRNQIDRWNAWHDENEALLESYAEAESAGNEVVMDALKAKIKPEPKNGITPPDGGLSDIEYFELCADRALDFLRSIPDKQFSEIVKAFRHPSDYIIDDSGKAKKLDVVSGKPETKLETKLEKPKTPDELKAEAHTALLAYVSALGDSAPKSLKTALMVLDSKGGDK